MTNAETIRAMTDTELAKWLDERLGTGREWFDARTCERCKTENAGRCPAPEDGDCVKMGDNEILDWLQEAAQN